MEVAIFTPLWQQWSLQFPLSISLDLWPKSPPSPKLLIRLLIILQAVLVQPRVRGCTFLFVVGNYYMAHRSLWAGWCPCFLAVKQSLILCILFCNFNFTFIFLQFYFSISVSFIVWIIGLPNYSRMCYTGQTNTKKYFQINKLLSALHQI